MGVLRRKYIIKVSVITLRITHIIPVSRRKGIDASTLEVPTRSQKRNRITSMIMDVSIWWDLLSPAKGTRNTFLNPLMIIFKKARTTQNLKAHMIRLSIDNVLPVFCSCNSFRVISRDIIDQILYPAGDTLSKENDVDIPLLNTSV